MSTEKDLSNMTPKELEAYKEAIEKKRRIKKPQGSNTVRKRTRISEL